MPEMISDRWGIYKDRGYWKVFFDEEMMAVCGSYETRRRAKKEITHYIERGLAKGTFAGAYKYMKGLAA
jgi:hypothetical protein